MISVVARLAVAVLAVALLGACGGGWSDGAGSSDQCSSPHERVEALEEALADLEVKEPGRGDRPMPVRGGGRLDDRAGRAWDAAKLQLLKKQLALRDQQARVIVATSDCWDAVVVANARGLADDS